MTTDNVLIDRRKMGRGVRERYRSDRRFVPDCAEAPTLPRANCE
jgi:hypothetical protein